jgi:copper chaperone CopZ
MKTKTLALATTLPLLLCAAVSWAAGPNATRISVEKMCCSKETKKIGARLYVQPGVVLVECDVKAKFVFVTPQANKQLSPRMIWECIEQADCQPVKLEGPHGVFVQKPNF